MTDWKRILAGADDDYLTGLSNKGTVKRAHKDRETVRTQILDKSDEGIKVKAGEEEVLIRPVLANSQCSCPSRSICRHIVQAVLVLREVYEAEEGGSSDKTEETEESMALDELWRAILEIENQKIIRGLGARKLREVLEQIRAGNRARITRSSTVCVELPDSDVRVRFLLPLEYSSCSCKKKGFCSHRAAAALWCRAEAGTLCLEAFEKEKESPEDMEGIRTKAGEMKRALEDIVSSGLSRAADESADTLERLAVISHNEGLAAFEDFFRSLQNGYEAYFRRLSSANAGELMEESARLYDRVCRLNQVKTAGELQSLGGFFHMDYEPVGDLELIGITAEAFHSRNGYQGERIYFLEKNTKQWYTYTSARPVYYDSPRGQRRMEKAAAPWGLNVSLEDLAGTEILLKDAKAGRTGRLSSGQNTKGIMKGKYRFDRKDAGQWFYEDFASLFKEQCFLENRWMKQKEEPLRMVCVQAAFWDTARFSPAEQKFSMAVYDSGGRELLAELPYSRREDANIRYLEQIADQAVKGKIPLPVLMGKLYLKEGKMILYPLEIFRWNQDVYNQTAFSDGNPVNICGQETILRINMIEQVYHLLKDISQQMEDLYQGGFRTVHDNTLQMLRVWAVRADERGLSFLGRELEGLCCRIEACRHSLHPVYGPQLEHYVTIVKYLWAAEKKAEFDLAKAYYTQG